MDLSNLQQINSAIPLHTLPGLGYHRIWTVQREIQINPKSEASVSQQRSRNLKASLWTFSSCLVLLTKYVLLQMYCWHRLKLSKASLSESADLAKILPETAGCWMLEWISHCCSQDHQQWGKQVFKTKSVINTQPHSTLCETNRLYIMSQNTLALDNRARKGEIRLHQQWKKYLWEFRCVSGARSKEQGKQQRLHWMRDTSWKKTYLLVIRRRETKATCNSKRRRKLVMHP